jgi:hypothetical protein
LITCEMRHNMRSQNLIDVTGNKSVCNGHCSDKIGVTSSGVTSSSLTKSVTAPQPQMAEQDCGEGEEMFWRAVVTCGLPQRGRSCVLFVAL